MLVGFRADSLQLTWESWKKYVIDVIVHAGGAVDTFLCAEIANPEVEWYERAKRALRLRELTFDSASPERRMKQCWVRARAFIVPAGGGHQRASHSRYTHVIRARPDLRWYSPMALPMDDSAVAIYARARSIGVPVGGGGSISTWTSHDTKSIGGTARSEGALMRLTPEHSSAPGGAPSCCSAANCVMVDDQLQLISMALADRVFIPELYSRPSSSHDDVKIVAAGGHHNDTTSATSNVPRRGWHASPDCYKKCHWSLVWPESKFTLGFLQAAAMLPIERYLIVHPLGFVIQRPFPRSVLLERTRPQCPASARCPPNVSSAVSLPPGCCFLPLKAVPPARDVGRVVRVCG